MKKISKIFLSAVVAVTLIFVGAFSVVAYEPYDSDFVKVWDVVGEILTDEEGRARLEFANEKEGCWAGRVNYNEMVELDGLEVKIINIEMVEGAAPVIMFGNELGEWCDSPDAFMMGLYNVRSHETLGELEHGYFAVTKGTGRGTIIVEPVALESAITSEITFNLKKDTDKWVFTVNGQAFDLPADSFEYLLDEASSFINFGNYSFEGGHDLAYSITEINQLDTDAPNPTDAPDDTDPTTAGETTKAPESGSTTKAPESGSTTAANGDKTDSNDMILYIVLGCVVVAAIIVAVIIIVKSKKTSGGDK